MTPSEQERQDDLKKIERMKRSLAANPTALTQEACLHFANEIAEWALDRLQAYLSKPADAPPLPDTLRVPFNHDEFYGECYFEKEEAACIAFALNQVYGKEKQK